MDNSMFTKQSCEFDYTVVSHGELPAVFCTVAICYGTFFLEIVVHSYMNCCNTIRDEEGFNPLSTSPDSQQARLPKIVVEQPRSEAPPRADSSQGDASQPNESGQSSESAHANFPPSPTYCDWCVANPSPNIRANRLIVAIFLYAAILAAFIIRIDYIRGPDIRYECQRYVSKHSIPGPNWWIIGLFNILPFFIATLSLSRTVVDLYLVRSGRGLKYAGQNDTEDWTTWPPCMAFFLVFVCIRTAVRWPIILLMGTPRHRAGLGFNGSTHADEDIEMRGEETRGLVDGVDDGDSDYEGDDVGPPAYGDAVHGRRSVSTSLNRD